MSNLEMMGRKAKEASIKLSSMGGEKRTALLKAAESLVVNKEFILQENKKDIQKARDNGMPESKIDRLMLDSGRIEDMAKAVTMIAEEEDPVGRVIEGKRRPNGLLIEKVTVPIGVIGIIYESRPNVTSDSAALCIKAGNAALLKGGREALNSNKAIAGVIRDALAESGLPEDSVQLIEDTSRETTKEFMELKGYLDVLIPRGGASLINAVKDNAKVPVIETGVGNCHLYIDKEADINMAVEIAYNAKTSRPSVCNAIETLLVHEDIAKKALPLIKARLDEKAVIIRGDVKTAEIIECEKAAPEDWSEEYLDYIIAVKVVSSIDEAIVHIQEYSTGHSEAIITNDLRSADEFINRIDSAAVYVNASTRFTDGGEFGLGAEIGISTQKIHARGPMGLSQLISYKYIIKGNGQIR